MVAVPGDVAETRGIVSAQRDRRQELPSVNLEVKRLTRQRQLKYRRLENIDERLVDHRRVRVTACRTGCLRVIGTDKSYANTGNEEVLAGRHLAGIDHVRLILLLGTDRRVDGPACADGLVEERVIGVVPNGRESHR